MKNSLDLKRKTLIWIHLLTSLPRCQALKARFSRMTETAIYLGTLKLSHPEPRGVIEIRASGDLRHLLLKVSLNAGGRLLFSHLHTLNLYTVYICACMNEHLHETLTPLCLSFHLSAFVKSIWKVNERHYSHLWLWHHFSVFTLFHIIYLL